ncbi:acyltransferase-domain-containing protein [Aureobasidium pullulans]|uniref:Acyltransferase-domain-containing protein n=1 Tax=Aureobasidium pullulans TaxID=5580 RepID=A0A4T0E7D7_AURPU|nr:acyltransferase-domain-containing protein [Aureobasidium pullulans]THW38109.1 acyltransferase-domain-containing protein [Aureobasidium pullulans]THY46860.1 acyltransferase-domain-containing protein [Aureobasidium pullulans]THY59055.1 acyltransferase-domain-containing protein [Aureobasidium pullulans]TIA69669.1 acyltransferase-domain-containing protein [Aureobasidium pullulans]
MSRPQVEAASKAFGDTLLGAGFDILKSKAGDQHPAGPPQHGTMGQAERAFSAASTFLSGVLAISASQFIGAPLKLIDPKFYDGYMAWTKESFAVLTATMTQWWAPTAVRVTGDESMKDQLYQMEDGSLRCNFPHRIVMMANHQLYTDWLYLWWIAYTNKMHGRIYIILKESLKNVPIFGWGAQFYNFIFLSRKWETDKSRFQRHLSQLSDPKDPMWLLIFPEGTNLSETTRAKSKAWADKQGISDMKHQLLPRTTGLQFCLQRLKESTNWLYDCTIAYEGVPEGQFGQDIFTLRSSFFEGRPPKSVNMYWRRYKISEIPIDNDEAFGRWLKNRWTEKDYLLEHFYRHGSFPAGCPIKAMQAEAALQKLANGNSNGEKKKVIKPVNKTAKFITTEVKAGGWEEFLAIFAPITAAATALSSGDIAPGNIDFDALLNKVAQQQQLNLLTAGKAPKTTQSTEDMRQALTYAAKSGGGQQIKGSTIEKITRDAARTQREIQESMGKHPMPEGSKRPTAGRNLDPTMKNTIENVHDETRRRLMKASQSASPKPAPNVRKSLPMTPVETAITRPISTLAMQKAKQGVQKIAENSQKQRAAPVAKKAGTSGPSTATKQPAQASSATKKTVTPNGTSASSKTASAKVPHKAAAKPAPAKAKKPATS